MRKKKDARGFFLRYSFWRKQILTALASALAVLGLGLVYRSGGYTAAIDEIYRMHHRDGWSSSFLPDPISMDEGSRVEDVGALEDKGPRFDEVKLPKIPTATGRKSQDGNWEPRFEELEDTTDYVMDVEATVYTIDCTYEETGKAVRIHMITDTGTVSVWWQHSWQNALITEGKLVGCVDVSESEVFQSKSWIKGFKEIALVMFNLDLWFTQNEDQFIKVCWAAFLSRQQLIKERRIPVAILFSENPDLGMPVLQKMEKFLDTMQVGGNRYVITYNAIFATNDEGGIPLASRDSEMSRKRWDTLFPEAKRGPGDTGHLRGLFWNSYWWSLLEPQYQNKTLCKPESTFLPLSKRPKPFLALGGDSQPFRALVLMQLHNKGYLNSSLWSLQTPLLCCMRNAIDCSSENHPPHARPQWQAIDKVLGNKMDSFCPMFPKKLDIALDGSTADSDKDRTFPPQSLYDQTRFSIVFESIIVSSDLMFLTEKVLKPLHRGHPYLLLCASKHSHALIKSFGFETFQAVIDESYDASSQFSTCHLDANNPQKFAKTVDDAVQTIVKLARKDPKEWDKLNLVVQKNQRHMHCGGFRRNMMSHATAILELMLAAQ